jgi:hypothetical protein
MLTRRAALLLPALAVRAQAPRDVFLLAGQSNMAGRGVVEAQDRQPVDGVLVWNREGRWAPAIDPLHWDKPEIAGVGLGRNFAATLAGGGATVGLVPCAFGGSALWEWMPGEKHYVEALRRARGALAAGGRLRGLLWHQGESESTDESRARGYGANWLRFVSALRQELSAPDLPAVVGELGRFVRAPFAGVVNEQLAWLPLRAPRTAFVPSEGLHHKGDDLHFDSASLREFGRRYAQAWRMIS